MDPLYILVRAQHPAPGVFESAVRYVVPGGGVLSKVLHHRSEGVRGSRGSGSHGVRHGEGERGDREGRELLMFEEGVS